jgi:O-acetylhomoserine/O-acetylserine sulfhydrylase-like pyridoxal-dependent enzyme
MRSTIFASDTCEDLARDFRQRSDRVYARFGNPTASAAAQAVARLEGAQAGALFASGMAAISTTLIALTRKRSHVVCQSSLFAQTRALLSEVGPTLGITTTFVDPGDLESVERAVTNDTALIYEDFRRALQSAR